MASTVEGRELTRAHQAAQIRNAIAAQREAKALWGRLDINDLDGSTAYWLGVTAAVVDRRLQAGQELAGAYLREYQVAETGEAGPVLLQYPAETAVALRFAGPVRVKRLIAGGMDPRIAHERAFVKFGGMVQRQAQMASRLTIARSTGADRRAIGWRRVTDGNPCAFCAMLASRGPVYRDAAAAEGLQYHAHCGCTAEPMYSIWEPSDREQEYIDAYQRAQGNITTGGMKRTTKNVLAEMRREGSFRDSVS